MTEKAVVIVRKAESSRRGSDALYYVKIVNSMGHPGITGIGLLKFFPYTSDSSVLMRNGNSSSIFDNFQGEPPRKFGDLKDALKYAKEVGASYVYVKEFGEDWKIALNWKNKGKPKFDDLYNHVREHYQEYANMTFF